MGRKRRTMLLELPDADGGIAVLADGTRVYWGLALRPQLVARNPDGVVEAVPSGENHPVREAFVALCDRGASITRKLKPAEEAELAAIVADFAVPSDPPEPSPSEPTDQLRETATSPDEPASERAVVHRVFPLPAGLRAGVRDARTRSGLTNRDFVARAVADHMPGLVEALTGLGFGSHAGPSRPVRLPFSRAAGTLDALRDAGRATGVPASQLLLLCLSAATAEPTPEPARRGRRAASGR